MTEAEKEKKKGRVEMRYKGKGGRVCKLCGSSRALIRKYSLNICRRCFREVGKRIGFEKFG